MATATTAPRVLYRPPAGWRTRHLIGALGLRPAAAQHTQAEAALLMRYASGAQTIVELGVAEGGSAAELRSVLSPDGRLILVDPFEAGRLRVSLALIVARRAVNAVRNGSVEWIRTTSGAAGARWSGAVDFLFIDADHSYERAAQDWELWTPHVRAGGFVALHDSVLFPGGWTHPTSGPVRLLREVLEGAGEWELVEQADSLTVLRRRGGGHSANGSATQLRGRSVDAPRPPTPSALRILRVADVPHVATAGMSGFMLSSASELERGGHRVGFWFRGQLAPGLRTPGVRRLVIPWLVALKVITSRRRYDVVEVHEPLAAPLAIAARLLGARLPVCGVLSFGLEDRSWRSHLEQLRRHGGRPPLKSRVLVPLTLISQAVVAVMVADPVLVASSQDRDHLVSYRRLAPERVACAFTGVDPALLTIEREPLATARCLFLGSWIDRKGRVELLEAWRRLSVERPDVRLTIAGVGDGQQVLADVDGLDHVDVIPFVERQDLPALLAGHDVFVLPSAFEGLPLAMLEAAAAGLACVVSDVCGNLDVFRPRSSFEDGALLIPPNDAAALYRALLEVVDDRSRRATLGRNARERARQFTWTRTAEQLTTAYEAALSRRGARVPA